MPPFPKAGARNKFIMIAVAFDKFLQTAEQEAKAGVVA